MRSSSKLPLILGIVENFVIERVKRGGNAVLGQGEMPSIIKQVFSENFLQRNTKNILKGRGRPNENFPA